MSDPARLSEPLVGRCLCKAVGITLDRAEPVVDVCQCEMCHRWGGMLASIQGEAFTITGQDSVATYRSSDWAERAFCKRCGSNLWYRFLPADHYNFLAGLFDLPEAFAIRQQIFINEKPGWFDLAQDTACKTGAEVIAEARAEGYDISTD